MNASYATNIKCHLKSKLAVMAAGVNNLNIIKSNASPNAIVFQIILDETTPLRSTFSIIIFLSPLPLLPMFRLPLLHPTADIIFNIHPNERYKPSNWDTNLSPSNKGASNPCSSASTVSGGGEWRKAPVHSR